MVPSTISAPPASSPISWQTAFWTLIPLAINVMAQPSGRVCGLPAKYGVYLRNSPIICAADILSLIFQVLSCCIFYRFSPRESIRIAMRDRFENDESIEALKRVTWLRWLFFILGTLGSAVKVLAMEGVPWTKTWGILFLASFLILEVLIMISWKTIGIPSRSVREPDSKLLNSRLFLLACFLHGLLLFCALADLWPRKYGWFADPSYATKSWAMKTGTFTMVLFFESSAVFSFGILGGVLLFLSQSLWKSRNDGKLYQNDDFMLWWLMLIVMFIFALIFRKILGDTIGLSTLLPDTGIILVCFVVPIYFPYFKLQQFCEKYPEVADNLLLTRSEHDRTIPDRKVYWCFVLFLYSLVICTLWYRIRYNPAGTQDPGWIGVFG